MATKQKKVYVEEDEWKLYKNMCKVEGTTPSEDLREYIHRRLEKIGDETDTSKDDDTINIINETVERAGYITFEYLENLSNGSCIVYDRLKLYCDKNNYHIQSAFKGITRPLQDTTYSVINPWR